MISQRVSLTCPCHLFLGETEEEIVMWDLEKGRPDPGQPSLMDLKPHYLEEKL